MSKTVEPKPVLDDGSYNRKSWRSFEDAVRSIINEHHEYFQLSAVEPTAQKVPSESGYVYDVEVVGYAKGSSKIVLFEVRKRKRNVEPGQAGELAYRIETTGAESGYFVTKLDSGLSAGAKKITDHVQIGHIQVSADATPDEYMMKHLNNFFIGIVTRLVCTQTVEYQLVDKDGNIKSQSPNWL